MQNGLPPYKDSTKPVEARIADLLSRMTLEEKVRQMDIYSVGEIAGRDEGGAVLDTDRLAETAGDIGIGCLQSRGTTAPFNNAVQEYHAKHTRLGIPALMSEEALHGLFRQGCTIFPQQITLAATWDERMAYEQGHAIARETRSLGIHETWSPVLDLGRDPRWGRVQEGYGEDTYLSAAFGRAMVKGLQGDDVSAPDRIVAEPKHFSGYGQPVGGLNCAPAAMGRHEHHAYCLPVFEAAYEAGALNAMCSYASIDGVPCAGDPYMLTDVLRGQLGMKGFVRSDMTAVTMLHTAHHVAADMREALKMGVLAGVDMQLYDFPHDFYQNTLIEMARSGELPEEVIDRAAGRVLRVKFLLGLFENTFTDPELFDKTAMCPAHLDVALNVARKAVTLLKNANGILPFKKDIKTIAVIGPSADAARMGDYTGPHNPSDTITLLDGIKKLVSPGTTVLHAAGCHIYDEAVIPFGPDALRTPDGEPGLHGEYFNNADLSGQPVLCQTDARIAFNWIFSKPGSGVNADRFSARWTGALVPARDVEHVGLSTMDGMRLYINGALIVDAWGSHDRMTMLRSYPLRAGEKYDICVEFRNDARGARVIFGYSPGELDMDEAVEAARQADVAVIAVGDSGETCGENFDRLDLNLPGRQQALVKAVCETGTPVVLVLQNGRPLTLQWENDHVAAIVEAWFPGQMGGQAIAEALFGDINPAGRLPLSFPKSVGQLPLHYSRKPGGGLKYVEGDSYPLFPFGYGLSYTSFAYENLTLSAQRIAPDGTVEVTFDVINTGPVAGDEVAQLYVNDVYTSVVTPKKELKGFRRIHLEPGERRTVALTLGFRELRLLNRDFRWVVEPGLFRVMVGAGSDDLRLFGEFNVE